MGQIHVNHCLYQSQISNPVYQWLDTTHHLRYYNTPPQAEQSPMHLLKLRTKNPCRPLLQHLPNWPCHTSKEKGVAAVQGLSGKSMDSLDLLHHHICCSSKQGTQLYVTRTGHIHSYQTWHAWPMWGLLKVFLPKACAQRSLCRWSLAQSFEATAIGSVTRGKLDKYERECDV